jgi:LysR family transcriptional regulator, transcriptional activator of nhaA
VERLNYQHLYYFWNVVKEGSIARACEKLHLTQPTISGQLAVFEQAVGEKLFRKSGRKLEPTDTGRIVYRFAEEIFVLGRELTNTLKGRPTERGAHLGVGITEALPKLITYLLIEPALQLSEPVQLVCYEDKLETLLGELCSHGLDLVLSDVPAPTFSGASTFNHLLGECSVAVFGNEKLVQQYSAGFPHSLDGAPMLLPTINSALRRSLDQWFDTVGLSPQVQAEIEDSALIKTFAGAGAGLFVAPVAVEAAIKRQYGLKVLGRIEAVKERFYAVTVSRKVKNPGVTAILESARERILRP